jgi:hypothetical protein
MHVSQSLVADVLVAGVVRCARRGLKFALKIPGSEGDAVAFYRGALIKQDFLTLAQIQRA